MLFVCGLSFALTGAAVLGMFGLSLHRPLLLLPIIATSAAVCVFHTHLLVRWLRGWWADADAPTDVDWVIIFSSAMAFQGIFMLVSVLSTNKLQKVQY